MISFGCEVSSLTSRLCTTGCYSKVSSTPVEAERVDRVRIILASGWGFSLDGSTAVRLFGHKPEPNLSSLISLVLSKLSLYRARTVLASCVRCSDPTRARDLLSYNQRFSTSRYCFTFLNARLRQQCHLVFTNGVIGRGIGPTLSIIFRTQVYPPEQNKNEMRGGKFAGQNEL